MKFLKLYRTGDIINQIKASLRYIGGYIKEATTARWQKLFYRPKMLSGTILSFWIGVNHWSAESIDLEGFSLLVTRC